MIQNNIDVSFYASYLMFSVDHNNNNDYNFNEFDYKYYHYSNH